MDPILIMALISFMVLVVAWLALPQGEAQVSGEHLSAGAPQRAAAKA